MYIKNTFSKLDQRYNEHPEAYKILLETAIDELTIATSKIAEVFQTQDMKQFVALRHKLVYLLFLVEDQQLTALLQSVKSLDQPEETLAALQQSLVQTVHRLTNIIKHKIHSLTRYAAT